MFFRDQGELPVALTWCLGPGPALLQGFASACGWCCFLGGLGQHSSVWLRAWIPLQVGLVSLALQSCFYALSVLRESHLLRVHVCPLSPFPLGFQLPAHLTLKRSIPSRD